MHAAVDRWLDRPYWLRFHWLGLWGVLAIASEVADAQPTVDPRPNVIVVLADDLGFSDVGCFGSEIRTPQLDSLAQQGVRFTQFYNFSRCCPTRAAILTGHYPHQVGLRQNGRDLSSDVPTIAELLSQAGYATSMVGKWHLTQAEPRPGSAGHNSPEHLAWINNQAGRDLPFGRLETYPTRRGFDEFYGIIWGVIHYNNPFSLVSGTQPVRDFPEGFHLTDAINEKAVAEVRRLAARPEPFFLYLAHCTPHWPIHAPQDLIDSYDGVYDGGWESLRTSRFERQVELGLIDRDRFELPAVQQTRAWSDLTDDERAVEARCMQTHAAMVEQLDRGLAGVLQALRAAGELENTLIIFLADNGASPELPQRPGYDRPSELADGTPLRYGRELPAELVGSPSSYTAIHQSWASAVNTPYRYWKARSFEGGMHTPAIVHWPSRLRLPAGSFHDAPLCAQDIAATILDIAAVEYPHQWQGQPLPTLPARSFAALLENQPFEAAEALYFEHQGSAAIRVDPWKLVRFGRNADWELYHLDRDPTEIHDLASQRPQQVAELSVRWRRWFDRVTAE